LNFGGTDDRITCSFPYVETKGNKGDGTMQASYGRGPTRDEAMEDYAKELEGRWLIYRATNATDRMEFQLPDSIDVDPPEVDEVPEIKPMSTMEQAAITGMAMAVIICMVTGAYTILSSGVRLAMDMNPAITKVDDGYQITLFPEPEPKPSYITDLYLPTWNWTMTPEAAREVLERYREQVAETHSVSEYIVNRTESEELEGT